MHCCPPISYHHVLWQFGIDKVYHSSFLFPFYLRIEKKIPNNNNESTTTRQ